MWNWFWLFATFFGCILMLTMWWTDPSDIVAFILACLNGVLAYWWLDRALGDD